MVSTKSEFTKSSYEEKLTKHFLHFFLSRITESVFPLFSREISIWLVNCGQRRKKRCSVSMSDLDFHLQFKKKHLENHFNLC